MNRCLTEGRRSFLDRCADIESGRECERWAPLLSSLADGEASAKDVTRLRPHLRHCPACRARLGEYRRSPRHLAAVMPVAALGLVGDGTDTATSVLTRLYEAIAGGLHERAVLSAHRVQATVEAATTGKVAAVAASAAALAGGGVAVTGAAGKAERPAQTEAKAERVASSGPTRSTAGRMPAAFVSAPARTTSGSDKRNAPDADRSAGAARQPASSTEFAPGPAATSERSRSSSDRGESPSAPPRGPGEFEP